MNDKKLIDFALELYDAGFNVVPVDDKKKPLVKWSSTSRISREELIEKLKEASGIAIVGGTENPSKNIKYALLIVDIDDPDILKKTPLLKDLLEQTVVWRTGPRCPRCNNKHLEIIEPGKKFRCPNCNLEFSITEAKRGLGALFKLPPDVYEKYFNSTIRTKQIEFLVNNYQLIPPSRHPTGVQYEWVRPIDLRIPGFGIYVLEEEEARKILEEVENAEGKKVSEETKESGENAERKSIGELRELKDNELLKIFNLLKEVYRPGHRQFLLLYLSGWFANAKIHPLSAVKLTKMLHESSGDEDSLKMRLSAIVYSYKKAGIDIDKYADEIEKIAGVKPYGLEKEIKEDKIKGKSGVQEILEEIVGEEKALAIMEELEEILESASPYKDSIIGIMNYEKQIYAVANLRKLIIVRAKKENDRMIYKERIASVAPTKIIVYENPIETIKKYQITFEGQTLSKPLVIGPALLEEIIDRLKMEGGIVFHSRLLPDVLNVLVDAYIRKGKAEIRTEIDKPGFYMIDDKLIAINYEYENIDFEKLKLALELLNELAEVWFKHIKDKFSTVIKWGAIAPFSYVLKQKGRFLKWLFLYGDSATGKTTLGRIILKIWGLDAKYEKTGASIDTVARAGHVLSQSTFPILINEPGSSLSKEDLVDTIKNAIDNTVARSKYIKGTYVDFPALAPLIFTSNRTLIRDDALLRRLYVVTFSFSEKIPPEKQKEFKEKVEQRLNLLSEIGKCIAKTALESPRILDITDPLNAGKELLKKCYESSGLKVPDWLELTHESNEDIYEDIIDSIRSYLIKRINDEYTKFVGKVIVEKPKGDEESIVNYEDRSEVKFTERIMIVLENRLLPWAFLKDGHVIITSDFVRDLGNIIGSLGGLKSIAELLGWEYTRIIINGVRVRCAKTSVEQFVDFLTPSIE